MQTNLTRNDGTLFLVQTNLTDLPPAGAFNHFPTSGYSINFGPSTPQQDFQEELIKSKSIFFGNGARALEFKFTVYSPVNSWWVRCRILFDYGIED